MTTKLTITHIKAIHSVIWFIMAVAIMYTLYSGITGKINAITYWSIFLIVFEIVTLLINKWTCPLTNIARNIKSDWQDGDDIFLPTWLAMNNKQIFGTLFILGVVLVILRLVF